MENINRRDLLKAAPLALTAPAVLASGAVADTIGPKPLPVPLGDDIRTIDESLLFQAIEPARQFWANTGLLQGLHRDDDMTVIAAALQNQHAFNNAASHEASTLSEDGIQQIIADLGDVNCPALKRVSIPIVRRVWGYIAENNWVPTYPALSPSSFVWYWRLRWPTPRIYTFPLNQKLLPESEKPRLVKESESVVMSMFPTGIKYPWKDGELHDKLYADGKNGLQNQADYCADLAKQIADQIQTDAFINMHRNAGMVINTTVEEFTAKDGMARALSHVQKAFGGYRAGKPILVIPAEACRVFEYLPLRFEGRKGFDLKWADIDLSNEYCQGGGDVTWERRPAGSIPAVLAWKGDRMTDNGYFVVPYVTVARKNGEIVTRYGRRLTREGGKFYAAINFRI